MRHPGILCTTTVGAKYPTNISQTLVFVTSLKTYENGSLCLLFITACFIVEVVTPAPAETAIPGVVKEIFFWK